MVACPTGLVPPTQGTSTGVEVVLTVRREVRMEKELIKNVAGVEVVSPVEGERWFLTGLERTQAGTVKYKIAVPNFYALRQCDGTYTQYRYVPAYELKLRWGVLGVVVEEILDQVQFYEPEDHYETEADRAYKDGVRAGLEKSAAIVRSYQEINDEKR